MAIRKSLHFRDEEDHAPCLGHIDDIEMSLTDAQILLDRCLSTFGAPAEVFAYDPAGSLSVLNREAGALTNFNGSADEIAELLKVWKYNPPVAPVLAPVGGLHAMRPH